MAKYHPPECLSARSNLLEDEVSPVLLALGPASVRREGRYRSPPPRPPPARSCLAARLSPRSERCGWYRARPCRKGRSLPAESAIGRVSSYVLPVLAANVVAGAGKRPV